jgi:hypothetical protein
MIASANMLSPTYQLNDTDYGSTSFNASANATPRHSIIGYSDSTATDSTSSGCHVLFVYCFVLEYYIILLIAY